MKLLTVDYAGTQQLGVGQDDLVFLPSLAAADVPDDMLALIRGGEAALAALRTAYAAAEAGQFVPAADVALCAPIPRPPQNIMCMGLNYADHVAEAAASLARDKDLPKYPIVFTKAANSVNSPYGDVPLDPAVSDKMDWEVELAVVIGQRGKNIAAADAAQYIFGYTVLNDISARNLQRRHQQFYIGKSLDGACPFGPCIVTADAIADAHNLELWCQVNGEDKQRSNTRYQIFSIGEQIAALSQGRYLEPGDIIATGTPSGVGFARTPPEFLHDGDVVECGIEQIGVLRNRIVRQA